jgi:hypothetical protein
MGHLTMGESAENLSKGLDTYTYRYPLSSPRSLYLSLSFYLSLSLSLSFSVSLSLSLYFFLSLFVAMIGHLHFHVLQRASLIYMTYEPY